MLAYHSTSYDLQTSLGSLPPAYTEDEIFSFKMFTGECDCMVKPWFETGPVRRPLSAQITLRLWVFSSNGEKAGAQTQPESCREGFTQELTSSWFKISCLQKAALLSFFTYLVVSISNRVINDI